MNEAFPDTNLAFDVQALPQQAVDLDHLATREDLMRATRTLETGLDTVADRDLPALDQKTADLARGLAALNEKAKALNLEVASVGERAARLDRHVLAVDQKSALFDGQTSALRAALEQVQTLLPGDDERKMRSFLNWIDRHQIRFGDGSGFENDARANEILREAALRLNDLPANVGFLIVGYADDSGVAQANERVSLARAEAVTTRLQELGVSLRRLVAVGRSNENRISQETGPNSANRRVEIELIFLQADID
jgi:outer membrane protein OmpA-like peptidoglycan-associated protein